jgi:hypothetical protein
MPVVRSGCAWRSLLENQPGTLGIAQIATQAGAAGQLRQGRPDASTVRDHQTRRP